jgi:anti-sigma B factor antagonist
LFVYAVTRSCNAFDAQRGDQGQDQSMDVAVTNREDGTALMTIVGAIDLTTASDLRHAMHGVLDRGACRVVVDVSGVEFCDSIGLGTFAYAHQHCTASGGSLRLASPTPFLARLLQTVGLAGPIPVHDSVDAALLASAPTI